MSKIATATQDADFLPDPTDGFYPIHRATKSAPGSTLMLRRLIAKGADVNVKTPWRRTPLLMACFAGEPKKVEMLLQAGADVNAADKDGNTPLHAAVCGSNKTVSMLIAAGADMEIANGEGMTPLRYACYMGKQGAVEVLCDAGANTREDHASVSLVFHVMDAKRHAPTTLLSIVKCLVEHGAVINFKHPQTGNTELHLAARLTEFDYIAWGGRFLDLLRLLIGKGVNPWAKNDKGESAIDVMNPKARIELRAAFKKVSKRQGERDSTQHRDRPNSTASSRINRDTVNETYVHTSRMDCRWTHIDSGADGASEWLAPRDRVVETLQIERDEIR